MCDSGKRRQKDSKRLKLSRSAWEHSLVVSAGHVHMTCDVDECRNNGLSLLNYVLSSHPMAVTSPYQCLTLSLLVLPPLLLTAYFMAAFPLPPSTVYVHPSLASLPPTSMSWMIYPEDFYPGGGYATFPNGKVGFE